MFGRDPITPIAKLLEPKLKFYGEKGEGLNMSTLRKLYTVVAENIRRAREKQPRQETPSTKIHVNDLVLVKDPDSAAFDPKYMPNYRVTAVYGRNRIEVQDEKGNKSVRRAAHVKLCEPVDKVIHQLPPQAVYEQYGRRSKLLIHPKDVPEVPLQIFEPSEEKRETIDEGDESQNRKEMEVTVHEISHNNAVKLKTISTQPTNIDTSDASWSRQEWQHRSFHIDGNHSLLVIKDSVPMDGDSSDPSTSRVNIVPMYRSSVELRLQSTGGHRSTEKQGDDSDESISRPETTAYNGHHSSDGSDESRCQPGITICKSEWTGSDSKETTSQDQRTLQSVRSDCTDESNSREARSSDTDKSIDTGHNSIDLPG